MKRLWMTVMFGACAWGLGAQEPGRTLRPQQATTPTAAPEARTALVIGNGADHSAPLKNPVLDARAMAGAPVTNPPVVSREAYKALDGSFTIVIPEGWKGEDDRHPYGDLTTLSGIRLTGPMGPDGAPVTISVLHYGGDRLFRTPDEFIRDRTNSLIRTDYDREAVVTPTKVGDRPGKAFQIRTFELVYLPRTATPPMQEGVRYELAPPHIQVDMAERYLVVPASKGYFVLGFRAPEKMRGEYQGTFDQVVESFQPRLP